MTNDDDEKRRYLSELLRQELVAAELGWGHSETVEESYWNFPGATQNTLEDSFAASSCNNNSLDDDLKQNLELPKLGMWDLYREKSHGKIDHVSDPTLRNPNKRNNNSEEQFPLQIQRQEKVIQATKAKSGCTDHRIKERTDRRNKLKSTDSDDQRVFLGGLPIGITERKLRQHLASLGYKVLRRPKILHGFAPEVWMKTIDQAKDLIEKGTIRIEGNEVEVRPYNSFTKLSELMKLPNVGKRSVFIGGLSAGTTTKNLLDVLLGMGMKVINYPVIKHGFARQVILDTISQAKTLSKMSGILVNGTVVDVRPFVNLKRGKRKSKI